MRYLILHDYMDNIGGGERVVLTLARELGAKVATCDLNMDIVKKMGFGDIDFIDLGTTLKTPPLKQIHASLKFSRAKFPDYDHYIFSGNWSHYASKDHRPNIWYCHTPVRAFYDLHEYYVKRFGLIKGLAFRLWTVIHRHFDQRAVDGVQQIVANSENTKRRISKYLGRGSKVVYPPIDTKRFRTGPSGDYWLSVNRIYPEKRIELQVAAFRKMPDENLKIVGASLEGDHSSEYEKDIKNSLPDNVKMLGRVPENDLIGLYANCRGVITTAMDEDLGMTPIEAMASGKPVIATAEGGHLETVTEDTGTFIEATEDALVAAVKSIGPKAEGYRSNCLIQAKRFDTVTFTKLMKSIIYKR